MELFNQLILLIIYHFLEHLIKISMHLPQGAVMLQLEMLCITRLMSSLIKWLKWEK